jgi:hypothetical protein
MSSQRRRRSRTFLGLDTRAVTIKATNVRVGNGSRSRSSTTPTTPTTPNQLVLGNQERNSDDIDQLDHPEHIVDSPVIERPVVATPEEPPPTTQPAAEDTPLMEVSSHVDSSHVDSPVMERPVVATPEEPPPSTQPAAEDTPLMDLLSHVGSSHVDSPSSDETDEAMVIGLYEWPNIIAQNKSQVLQYLLI